MPALGTMVTDFGSSPTFEANCSKLFSGTSVPWPVMVLPASYVGCRIGEAAGRMITDGDTSITMYTPTGARHGRRTSVPSRG